MTRSEVVRLVCGRLTLAGEREPDHRALLEAAVTLLYSMDMALIEAARAGACGAPYSVQKWMETDKT